MTKEDKQIAEMMGMKFDVINGEAMIPHFSGKEKTMIPLPFHPTTDANDDYLVLKHIRESWDEDKRLLFERAYMNVLREGPNGITYYSYEPGDYSRAALRVLSDE